MSFEPKVECMDKWLNKEIGLYYDSPFRTNKDRLKFLFGFYLPMIGSIIYLIFKYW